MAGHSPTHRPRRCPPPRSRGHEALSGHGEIDCMGLRQKCDESGLKGIPLFVGGNLVVGKQNFEDVKERFLAMGFDFVYPPSTPIEETIVDLKQTLGIA